MALNLLAGGVSGVAPRLGVARAADGLCADGKRSYFGVCPDGSTPRSSPTPFPAPAPAPAPTVPTPSGGARYPLTVCNRSGQALDVAVHYREVDTGRWVSTGWLSYAVDECSVARVLGGKNFEVYAQNLTSKTGWGAAGDAGLTQCVDPAKAFTIYDDALTNNQCPVGAETRNFIKRQIGPRESSFTQTFTRATATPTP